ncbi:hypothetical protein EVB91_195 [Rhizobium phage RHph_I1_18]|nr:hypothetical protein EVB91_195 [Rhizobium phage RHph_I1_18]
MQYRAGDKVAILRVGEIVIQEILWVRGSGSGQYYHTDYDDYLGDDQIIARIVDGKKIPNALFAMSKLDEISILKRDLKVAADWLSSAQQTGA